MAHEPAKPGRRNRIPRRTFLKLLAAGTLAGAKPPQVTAADPGPLERAGVSVNPNAPGATPKRGGMIVAGQPGDIVDFSPFQTGATRFPWHHNIYTPLFYYDSNLNVVPALAESYSFSSDKLTLTVKLRPGVKFHNGREFTADDVAFTFSYALDPKTGGAAFSLLKTSLGAVAVDKYTVQIKFKQPTAYVFDVLTFMGMVAKEAVGDIQSRAVGTGPFKFERWVPGEQLVCVRNENYWEPGLPYADGFRVRSFRDVATMILSLEAGEIDLTRSLPFSQIERVKKNRDLTVVQPTHLFFFNIYLNTKRPPFDNKKVRQAMAWSINRQAVVDSVLFGASEVANAPIPKSSWAYEPDLQKVYTFDLDRARRLLSEAGHDKGFEFTVVTSPLIAELTPIAVIWQQDLAKIGVKLNIQEMPTSDYAQRIFGGDFHAMVSSSGRGHKDPGSLFRIQPAYFPGGNNVGWQSREFEELLEKGAGEFDRAKRKPIYRKVQEMLLDEAFEIIIARNVTLYPLRPGKLRDMRLDTDTYWMFHRSWMS
jgi:peptide/nickel transport system substrate-binding protein